MIAKNFVETKYNAEVIYGDSVMPYTPITLKINDKISVQRFDEIDYEWFSYENFKINDINRTHKEQCIPYNCYVWTHKGWSKIKRFIRHKTIKKIYRIITNTGIVDVTEDHSLLDIEGDILKPKHCYINQELLHSEPIYDITYIKNNYGDYKNILQSYLYGVFLMHGLCINNNNKYTWYINSKNIELLDICKKYLESIEIIKFKIINYTLQIDYSDIDNNTFNNKIFYDKYIINCYQNNTKNIPNYLLNSEYKIIKSYINGVMFNNKTHLIEIKKNHSKIQKLIVLIQKLRYTFKIIIIDNKNYLNITKIDLNNKYLFNDNNIIINKNVLYKKYDGYVYDIETEYGVFHGGIGNIILKNTDSIFCKFPLKDDIGNSIYGKDALPYAIEIGRHVEKNIVSIMPSPQQLNYEKTLYPFILFSKKRYVGNLYENDINHFKQKSMGIVLKRRDNAQIVKKIYGGIIDILLNKQDLEESIEFLLEELEDLVNGKTPLDDLIISKTLRAIYKDPTKIAHKVLADRITARDAGNKPAINERIPYIYIKTTNAKLQGDKIESPDYIRKNNIIPDYLIYITNQIMKPILQLYALCLDELPNNKLEENYWINLEKELLSKPIYLDDDKRKHRLNNLKLRKVKELLFDKYINLLTEPKIKPIKSIKTVKSIKPVKTIENAINNDKNDIINNDDNYFNGIINIINKSKINTIVSNAKIINSKNDILWNYTNDNCKNKYSEIKFIIIEMVNNIAIPNNKCVHIKLNNKPFIKDFNKVLIKYDLFEKNELINNNLVKNAFDNMDIGIINNANEIMAFESIISIKKYFKLL